MQHGDRTPKIEGSETTNQLRLAYLFHSQDRTASRRRSARLTQVDHVTASGVACTHRKQEKSEIAVIV
jgi:hypothetical protein